MGSVIVLQKKVTTEIMKEQIFKELNEANDTIKQIPKLQKENGEWDKDLLKSIGVFFEAYFSFRKIKKKETYDVIRKYQCKAGQSLSKSKSISVLCKVIMECLKKGYRNEDGKTDTHKFTVLTESLLTLMNYSDCTPEVTKDIAGEPNFLETIKENLKKLHQDYVQDKAKEEEEKVMKWSLTIYYNISIVDDNIPRLRSLDIVPIFSRFLDANSEIYRLTALSALANIIDEKESTEVLQGKTDVIAFLLKKLGLALEDSHHKHLGWSAQECTRTVGRLARNDANKTILVELDCLPHLVKLAKIENMEEQREAVRAIHILTFNQICQAKIVNDKRFKIVDLLEEIKKKNSKDKEITKAIDVDKEITKAIEEITKAVEEITKAVDVDKETTKAVEEITKAVKEITKAVDVDKEITKAIEVITKAVEVITKAVDVDKVITKAFEEITKAVKEITKAVDVDKEITKAVEEITKAVEEITKAVEEITKTVEEITKAVEEITKAVDVDKVITKAVKEITKDVEDITKAVDVYKEITKAFEEIPKAVEEIPKAVDVDKETTKAVEEITKAVEEITKAVDLDKEITKAIEEITKAVEEITKAVDVDKEITKAVEEITKAVEEITKAVNIDKEITKAVEEITKAVEEITKAVDVDKEITKAVKEITKAVKEITKAVDGALWNLKEELHKKSNYNYNHLVRHSANSAKHSEDSSGRPVTDGKLIIMISYEQSDQEMLIKIRDLLTNNYVVCINDDNTIEVMAKSVEKAHVFLMCMSRKYKDNPFCQAAAEYASTLKKKIIPLKMENGYTPDGWLGFVCGAKLFFDFASEKYTFESKMKELKREIANASKDEDK